MAAAKKGSSSQGARATPRPGTLRWLVGPGRAWLAAALVLAAFFAAWYAVWRRVRPDVLASAPYQITVESFELTPRTDWVPANLGEQVFRSLTLEGPLSIFDEKLVERVKNAFALHPWVARVERVEKRHPARIRVELVYRHPVCAVETAGRLIVVDGEAVVLPDDDFTPLEKQTRFPRLTGIDSGPLGPVGTRWGNPRVTGGAEIAAVLLPIWEKCELERIVPSAVPGPLPDDEQTYELLTRRGSWIFWGRAPGAKAPGEPSAADKVARLERYLAEHGTLEGTTGPQKLDVTRADSIEIPRKP